MRLFLTAMLMPILLLSPLSSNAEQDEFKIGMLLCLTGSCASYGVGAQEGATIAAEELNAAGGVLGKKIKLIAQDTSEAVSGSAALSAYHQLRTDPEIRYFIGPTWTPAGLTLAPIVAKDSSVIMTSPSLGAKEFHSAGANIFNTRGIDESAVRAIARYAFDKGWKRAAIFSSQQPWDSQQGSYFEDEFKKIGGTVVAKVEPLPTITTLNAEALRIVSAKPDAVFFGTLAQQAIGARELKKLGWKGPLLAALIDEPRIVEAAGALEGAMFMSFQSATDAFVEKYKARLGSIPETSAAMSYDAVYAYAKSIQATNSFDAKQNAGELLKVAFDGASGPIAFDELGCVKRIPWLWRVSGTAFVRVSE